jgi:hypothetical protein
MGHHLLYINYLSFEVDLNYQPEVVPADVKHRAFTDGVGVRVNSLHVRDIQPLHVTGDLVPRLQGCQRIRMLIAELTKRSIADNVQTT